MLLHSYRQASILHLFDNPEQQLEPVHLNQPLNLTIVMLEQIQTLDKVRFVRLIGHLDEEIMKRIDQAAARSIGLNDE